MKRKRREGGGVNRDGDKGCQSDTRRDGEKETERELYNSRRDGSRGWERGEGQKGKTDSNNYFDNKGDTERQ